MEVISIRFETLHCVLVVGWGGGWGSTFFVKNGTSIEAEMSSSYIVTQA